MKILVTYNLPRTPFNNLPADWELTFPQNEEMPREEIIRLLPEYDVLLTIFHSHSPVDREIIDAGKRLRLISNYGVGYNNIDTAYAREKGIAVTNTPRSVCNPTAELAMALMLALARRVAECDRRIRTEKESLWGTMKNLGASLENKTLGIVGMGNIGKNVARKAEAFGMRVIYYNRRTEVSGYRRVPLDTLLQEADFVSLHTPLTTETRHLIGARELSLMKPTAMLINTARGAVIDETALADALRQKRIAGAALDVFENEPHVTDYAARRHRHHRHPHRHGRRSPRQHPQLLPGHADQRCKLIFPHHPPMPLRSHRHASTARVPAAPPENPRLSIRHKSCLLLYGRIELPSLETPYLSQRISDIDRLIFQSNFQAECRLDS